VKQKQRKLTLLGEVDDCSPYESYANLQHLVEMIQNKEVPSLSMIRSNAKYSTKN
jgi:hypothetical protein